MTDDHVVDGDPEAERSAAKARGEQERREARLRGVAAAETPQDRLARIFGTGRDPDVQERRHAAGIDDMSFPNRDGA